MKRCHKCEGFPEYDQTFDITYCPACNIWLEKQCACDADSGCPYSVANAGKLPETPGMLVVNTSIDQDIAEQLKQKDKIVSEFMSLSTERKERQMSERLIIKSGELKWGVAPTQKKNGEPGPAYFVLSTEKLGEEGAIVFDVVSVLDLLLAVGMYFLPEATEEEIRKRIHTFLEGSWLDD